LIPFKIYWDRLFSWVLTTPFGFPVVPEVYIIFHISSASTTTSGSSGEAFDRRDS
jgi:hypothetical protein